MCGKYLRKERLSAMEYKSTRIAYGKSINIRLLNTPVHTHAIIVRRNNTDTVPTTTAKRRGDRGASYIQKVCVCVCDQLYRSERTFDVYLIFKKIS